MLDLKITLCIVWSRTSSKNTRIILVSDFFVLDPAYGGKDSGVVGSEFRINFHDAPSYYPRTPEDTPGHSKTPEDTLDVL